MLYQGSLRLISNICPFVLGSQVALTGSQIWWATDVGIAFERVEEGFETALKDYNRKQVNKNIKTTTRIFYFMLISEEMTFVCDWL